MARSIPWARVLAEGVVIVVSILLGLGIDAWWSDVESRRTAYRELGTVLDELRESRDELERVSAWHSRMLRGTRSLREQLESVPLDGEVTVPDTMLAHLNGVATTDPPLAILDAFLAAGHIEELRNPELRAQLLGWAPMMQDLKDDELRARTFVDNEVTPYLLRQYDMSRVGEAMNGMWRGVVVADVPNSRVRSSQEFRSMVGWQISFYLLLSQQSEAALARLNTLIPLVEIELTD